MKSYDRLFVTRYCGYGWLSNDEKQKDIWNNKGRKER